MSAATVLHAPGVRPLLISRAVRRKNIPALVEAFGSDVLRQRHNLVCARMSRSSAAAGATAGGLQQLLIWLIARSLWPGQRKRHRRPPDSGPHRWAAHRRGVFVNPALTEPFGLTPLEAAGCGLPMVATDDGGPRHPSSCSNGLLVDVTDPMLFSRPRAAAADRALELCATV